MRSEHSPPRIAIKSIASGLFMMAVFTALWAMLAFNGLQGHDHYVGIVVFGILVITFLSNGIYFFSIAKRFPLSTSEEDIAEGKRTGKWFGIIFAGEGIGIFLLVNLVINLGHPDLTMPVIALVVGLHFYPLGWVFKRSIDYYLATWSTLVAVSAILLLLYKVLPLNDVFALTGTGIAIATSCYGLYMVFEGRRLAKMGTAETV